MPKYTKIYGVIHDNYPFFAYLLVKSKAFKIKLGLFFVECHIIALKLFCEYLICFYKCSLF